MTEHTHRYGQPEHTIAFPFTYSASDGPQGPRPPQREDRRGRNTGVLVAALLLGGIGGVGGAAGYDAIDNDSGRPTATAPRGDEARSAAPLDLGTGTTKGETPAPKGSPEAVAESVLPSVVMINVATPSGSAGSGSGIILSEDGEILTNNHVVEVAEGGGEMAVSFDDGTTAPATIVGTDPVTDLAVIRAEGVSDLTAATIGNSERLGVGEGVVAIGSPFGLEATVTSGIVSSLNRPVSVGPASPGTDPTTYPAIQTDAAINPGNSGGPLVNLAGEVVGINSSIRTSSSGLGGEGGSIGLGFAIPITKVLPIIEQLRNGETPTHAKLGVALDISAGNEGMVLGAVIGSVNEGSAADRAGVEPGDVVTRVNDQQITGSNSLVATIRGYRPGDEVTLVVVRDGQTKELTVTLDSDAESEDS